MPSTVLYVVALDERSAQRALLHLGSNPNILRDARSAQLKLQKESEIWDLQYKIFKGRVTVELLED
jgi:hypothetical protein